MYYSLYTCQVQTNLRYTPFPCPCVVKSAIDQPPSEPGIQPQSSSNSYLHTIQIPTLIRPHHGQHGSHGLAAGLRSTRARPPCSCSLYIFSPNCDGVFAPIKGVMGTDVESFEQNVCVECLQCVYDRCTISSTPAVGMAREASINPF